MKTVAVFEAKNRFSELLAAVAHGDQLLVDELDGADIDAARRLADDQDAWILLEFAGEHDLLLVAA